MCVFIYVCMSRAALVLPLRIVDLGDVETAVARQGCVCVCVCVHVHVSVYVSLLSVG